MSKCGGKVQLVLERLWCDRSRCSDEKVPVWWLKEGLNTVK